MSDDKADVLLDFDVGPLAALIRQQYKNLRIFQGAEEFLGRVAQVQGNIAAMREQVSVLEKDIEKLKKRKSAATKAAEKAESEHLEKVNTLSEQYENEKASLQDRFIGEKADMTKELTELEDELNSARSKHSAELADMQAQKDNLAAEIDVLSSELDALKRRVGAV